MHLGEANVAQKRGRDGGAAFQMQSQEEMPETGGGERGERTVICERYSKKGWSVTVSLVESWPGVRASVRLVLGKVCKSLPEQRKLMGDLGSFVQGIAGFVKSRRVSGLRDDLAKKSARLKAGPLKQWKQVDPL